MLNPALIESLEGRTLFNISLMDFIGSLKTSTRYDYDVYSGSTLQSTQVEEVMGPATFDGHSCTRLKSIFTGVSTPGTSEKDQYLTVDPTIGAIVYGSVQTNMFGSNTETITTKNSPAEVEAPFSLVPGKTYKSVYTSYAETVVDPGDHKSLQTLDITRHVTLESDTTVQLKVPAGTFNVYVLDVKETSSAGTELVRDWLAPGIGLIESQTPDQTVVLTGYKAG
jgi:hypothetical protein